MKKAYTLFIILLALSTATVSARNISEVEARRLAQQFIGTGTRAQKGSLQLEWDGLDNTATRSVLADAIVEPAPFYVYNIDGGGFVIIAGDDRLGPVLAYSTVNSFSHLNMPENLEAWIAYTTQAVTDIRLGKTSPEPGTRAVMGHGTHVLETAQWGQNAPFNASCPTVNSKQAVTGCAPLAAAILMRYYRYPSTMYGTLPAYTTRSYGVSILARTPSTYVWDNMPLEYDGSWTDEQVSAVSNLIYECGVAMQANYGPGETSTYNSDLYSSLMTIMKFSRYAIYANRSDYTANGWIELIMQQIDNGNPIIYTGTSLSDGGHAFIVDGYDDNGFIHTNFGWGGTSNGFYTTTTMKYCLYNAALIGMVPDESWTSDNVSVLSYYESSDGQVSKSNSFTLDTPYIEVGHEFTLKTIIANLSSVAFSGNISIAVCSSNGTVKQTLDTWNASIPIMQLKTYTVSGFKITSEPAQGDYLAVMYSTPSGQKEISGSKYAHIPLRYNLASAVSLKYDRDASTMTIGGLSGMTVTLGSAEYTLSYTNQLTISTAGLDGKYPLTIGNGHESMTVNLTF